jgi:hypothetical protein
VNFPHVVECPQAFRSCAELFASVNINAFRPELLNDALNGVVADLDYAKTTLAFMLSVLVLFASLPAGYALLAWRRRRPLLADRTVYLSVLLAFLLYPTLNQRLLKLYTCTCRLGSTDYSMRTSG